MNTLELKSKLSKSIEFLKSELAQVRTGRASPTLVEEVLVEAYGAKMAIKELGTIMVQDSQNLVVSPWDKTLIKSVSKGIRESGLGLNPVDEPDKVRIPIPALTEERRIELTKLVASKTEESKNALRATRQDIMKAIEKDFTDKNISEDEKFSQKEQVEEIVKEYVAQADVLAETKKKELLSI